MDEITEVFPEGSLEFWRQKARKLQKALERAEAVNRRTYCAYCGAEFLADGEAAEQVSEHIRTCEKHPMRALEAKHQETLNLLTAVTAERDISTEAWLRANDQIKELRAENERLRDEYLNACALVANMHKAAVGEITGPVRGVVEDVADLRALAQNQEDQLNRILQPGERWLELRAAAREAFDDDNADGWLIQHGAELGLSETRVAEAIRETLKELVKR